LLRIQQVVAPRKAFLVNEDELLVDNEESLFDKEEAAAGDDNCSCLDIGTGA